MLAHAKADPSCTLCGGSGRVRSQSKSASLEVRLPAAFFNDHAERELPTPKVLRENSRHVWVRSYDPALVELLNDARHYAHRDGPDECPRGLISSAKATVQTIERCIALKAIHESLAAHERCLPQLRGTLPIQDTESAIQSLKSAIALLERAS
jgi:hypothetical protein